MISRGALILENLVLFADVRLLAILIYAASLTFESSYSNKDSDLR